MLYCSRVRIVPLVAALSMCAAPLIGRAAPQLVDPSAGTLELITPSLSDRAKLDRIDGLAFATYSPSISRLSIRAWATT